MLDVTWTVMRHVHTQILVGDGAVGEARTMVQGQRRVPVITEPDVWDLHSEALTSAIAPSEPMVCLVDGERGKDLATVMRILDQLLSERVRRRDVLLGFGGGACCDVAGMVAMLYMRGMPYGLVPTSLMAQVDAAIGGKVGCNVGSRKNSTGGFWHPLLVATDPRFLETLPTRAFRAGLAEVCKLDVIAPERRLGELVRAMSVDSRASVQAVVERSVTAKLALLDSDPFEVHLNRPLNLGHAVAHALELLPEGSALHGEAVAIGLAATARYATALGVCSVGHRDRILRRLVALELPVYADVPVAVLAARIDEIRDHRDGELRLAVPSQDSGVSILEDADPIELAKCAVSRCS